MGPLISIAVIAIVFGFCVLVASVLFLLTPGVQKKLDSLAVFIAVGFVTGVLLTTLGIGFLYMIDGI